MPLRAGCIDSFVVPLQPGPKQATGNSALGVVDVRMSVKRLPSEAGSSRPVIRTLRRTLISYLVAVLSVALAVFATLFIGPAMKHSATLFFCSVMLTSWYGGLWPGVFAAILSVLALDYYFIPPLYALGIGAEDVADLVAFVATALFISWLNGGQRRAKESIRRARDKLDERVRERTFDLKKANDQLQSEIAEREAAESRLLAAQAEIARISRITTIGELAASIAHELNQPLGSIVMSGDACLRWLEANPPNLDEVHQAVEAIIRDGTRASNVLVRTRKLIRRGEQLRERLNINQVIHEVLSLVEDRFPRDGISLRAEMPESLPPAVVDRVLLQQVVLNLLLNAMDAMQRINDRPKLLRIRTAQSSGNIVVLVQDSGAGLDPNHLGRIFEAFYTTKVDGIGMGLTISRSIIEAHGGRLWAVANDGPGSSFYFTLPIEKEG
jgi:C4-dicarboxylate-specific signal transduction histidine kinase